MRDGTLLLETSTQQQADKVLAAKIIKAPDMLTDVPIKVEVHKQLNFSKGVIYCFDLLNCTVEDIKEELKDQGVTDVYRIHVRRDGQLVPTPSHILTFCTPQPPSSIKAAMYLLSVRQYIPSPLRCFKCQKYGHSQNNCSFASRCSNCAQNVHEDIPCTRSPHCVNCDGSHSARSKDCPQFKIEYKIQEIRTTHKISFAEARRKYRESVPSFSRSFANVASSVVKVDMSTQTCDMSTQTDISQNSASVANIKLTKSQKKKKSPSTQSRPSGDKNKPSSPVKSRSPINRSKPESPVKKTKVILNRDNTHSMTITRTRVDHSSSADSAMDDDISRPPHHRSDAMRKKSR